MSPVAHLVGLLPAASLGVHVYGVFRPVSLSVELFRNLQVRQEEAILILILPEIVYI